MESGDITCRQFIRTLADFLARDLAPGEQTQSELHLAVCPECVRYLKDYEVTIRLGSTAGEGDAPAMPDDLARVILRSRKNTDEA